MKNYLLILCCLLTLPCLAQHKHAIDIAYNKCIKKADSNSDGGESGPKRSCDSESLRKWKAEMKLWLAKLPSQKPTQVAWAQEMERGKKSLKQSFKEGSDIKSDDDLPMTYFDEVTWFETQAIRRRVLKLTKMAGGQAFIVEKDTDACDMGAEYLPKIGI